MKIKKSCLCLIALFVALSITFVGCNSNSKATDDSTNQSVENSQNQDSASSEKSTELQVPRNPLNLAQIPEYSDKAYIIINNNQPNFKEGNLIKEAREFYAPLDSLGRCGYAVASVCKETMPTGVLGSISHIKPSGWSDVSYNGIEGGYLYSKCHLIGWQLTGEDANTSNIITATQYMVKEGIMPFENMVADYVNDTGNHVMYRVSPIFDGDNLLASGVQLEGYSIEDNGEEICFNVYVYNVQPGIIINYATGESERGDLPENPNVEDTGENIEFAYIINKSSGTVHLPECASAKSIKPENKIESNDSLANLLNEGYKVCGNCNPT